MIKQKIQKSLSDWKNQHCKMDFTAFYRLQASDPSAAAKMKPALLLWSCLADLHAIFPPIPPATGPTYRLSTGLNAKSNKTHPLSIIYIYRVMMYYCVILLK